jgi:putative SOS response-associated peptidase YedK
MPVILPENHYETWLTPGEAEPDELARLLVPFDADLMEAYPVSRYVNNPKNDSPEMIQPI